MQPDFGDYSEVSVASTQVEANHTINPVRASIIIFSYQKFSSNVARDFKEV